MNESEQGFGAELRAARKVKGLTQLELSKAIGASFALISAWENNRRIPSRERIIQLSEILGHDFSGDYHKRMEKVRRETSRTIYLNPLRRLLIRGIEQSPADRISAVVEAGRATIDAYNKFLDVLEEIGGLQSGGG